MPRNPTPYIKWDKKLLGELKRENQSLHDQLEEARKAEEVLRKPKKDNKTSSQPLTQDEKAKITWTSRLRPEGKVYLLRFGLGNYFGWIIVQNGEKLCLKNSSSALPKA